MGALLAPMNGQHVFITYYKQKPLADAASCCARRLINSAVTPMSFYKNYYYRELEPFADVVVTVGDNNEAKCTPRERPTRPNCWNRFLSKAFHWGFPAFCVLWLAFGWPDDNYVRRTTLFAGLGARAFSAVLLMSVYS